MILNKQGHLLLREMICLKQLPVGQNVKSTENKQALNPLGVQEKLKKKPKWQESGDYCMGIIYSKQVLMLQSLLSSFSLKLLILV